MARERRLEPHAHSARRTLAGLGLKGNRLVRRCAQYHIPLGLEPVGFARHDLEGEQTHKRLADQFRLGCLPEGAGGGIGGGDAAGGIQPEDNWPFRGRGARGGMGGGGRDRIAQTHPDLSQRFARLARKSM